MPCTWVEHIAQLNDGLVKLGGVIANVTRWVATKFSARAKMSFAETLNNTSYSMGSKYGSPYVMVNDDDVAPDGNVLWT